METLFREEPEWVQEGGPPPLPDAVKPTESHVLVSVSEGRGEAVLCMGSLEDCEDALAAAERSARPSDSLVVRPSMPELPPELAARIERDQLNTALSALRNQRFRAYSANKGDDYDRVEFRERSEYVRVKDTVHISTNQMWQGALFKGGFYELLNSDRETRLRRFDFCAPEQQFFVVVPVVEIPQALGLKFVRWEFGIGDPAEFETLWEEYLKTARCYTIFHSHHSTREEADLEGGKLNDSGAYWGLPVRLVGGKFFTNWVNCQWEIGSNIAVSDPFLRSILSRGMTPTDMRHHVTECQVNDQTQSSAAPPAILNDIVE